MKIKIYGLRIDFIKSTFVYYIYFASLLSDQLWAISKISTECKTIRAEKKNSEKVANTNSEEASIKIIAINEINNYISNIIDRLEHDTALFSVFYIKLDELTLNSVGVDIRVMAKLIIDEIEKGDDFN
ncbi:11559_t:CDS:2 [Dentiscutata erythropus]|uniref:11559_t:CDS:1 n=1 Tax=Dentiscutata erythropus TaxID=1348616 RepID=A0A9N9BIY1_9GLOM|nr:11559_t:CDS:2 [Dentiscutata erythropus]